VVMQAFECLREDITPANYYPSSYNFKKLYSYS
jgi:hypothetical protein